jgi:hypothetical protein
MQIKTVSSIALAATCFVAFPVRADELQVKELDRGPTGFFVFDPSWCGSSQATRSTSSHPIKDMMSTRSMA